MYSIQIYDSLYLHLKYAIYHSFGIMAINYLEFTLLLSFHKINNIIRE